MLKYKRIIYIAAALYILGALVSFGLNHFGLHRSVARYRPDYCPGQTIIGGQTYCSDTTEIRYEFPKTWISWQFFSNCKRADQSVYLPFDVVIVVVLGGATYVVTRLRARRSPKVSTNKK